MYIMFSNWNDLPFELLLYEIKSFLFCKCSKCNTEYMFDDVCFNIYLKKYVTVFEDDFYIVTPDAIHFKVLCNKCHYDFLRQHYYPISVDNYKKTKKI